MGKKKNNNNNNKNKSENDSENATAATPAPLATYVNAVNNSASSSPSREMDEEQKARKRAEIIANIQKAREEQAAKEAAAKAEAQEKEPEAAEEPIENDDSPISTASRPRSARRARVSDVFVTPEHTYVERIKSPRRSGAESDVDSLAGEKHAHLDSEVASPHGVVARVPTPCADPEELAASRKREKEDAEQDVASTGSRPRSARRARVVASTAEPDFSYSERVKSPRRHAASSDMDSLVAEKHAHVDMDTASPSGYVQRVPTPCADPEDIEAAEKREKEDAEVASGSRPRSARRARVVESTAEPDFSYVERVKSPRRHAASSDMDSLSAEKHAHVDMDTASPSGYVQRVPTPANLEEATEIPSIAGATVFSATENKTTVAISTDGINDVDDAELATFTALAATSSPTGTLPFDSGNTESPMEKSEYNSTAVPSSSAMKKSSSSKTIFGLPTSVVLSAAAALTVAAAVLVKIRK